LIGESRPPLAVPFSAAILPELFGIIAQALMPQPDRPEIPNRSLFRQPEVCEIAHIQPYVLRSWEAEFPDLGFTKQEGGPRVYRRADVERVLRLKHMLFVEGLTLAGARRKLLDEQPPGHSDAPSRTELRALLGSDARERILLVKQGLMEIATLLSKTPGVALEQGFELKSLELPRSRAKTHRPAKPVKKKKR
jgi:DNA-binding transcriptional MerR regulator